MSAPVDSTSSLLLTATEGKDLPLESSGSLRASSLCRRHYGHYGAWPNVLQQLNLGQNIHCCN
eukprot:scaffold235450_cov18-Tisochrysis_lutea.AAC.1